MTSAKLLQSTRTERKAYNLKTLKIQWRSGGSQKLLPSFTVNISKSHIFFMQVIVACFLTTAKNICLPFWIWGSKVVTEEVVDCTLEFMHACVRSKRQEKSLFHVTYSKE